MPNFAGECYSHVAGLTETQPTARVRAQFLMNFNIRGQYFAARTRVLRHLPEAGLVRRLLRGTRHLLLDLPAQLTVQDFRHFFANSMAYFWRISGLNALMRHVAQRVRDSLPEAGLVRRLLRGARSLFSAGPSGLSAQDFTFLLALAPATLPHRTRPRVLLTIGSLSPGGAERQLVGFATSEITRARIETIIVLSHPLTGSNGHYASAIKDAGIPAIVVGSTGNVDPTPRRRGERTLKEQLAALPYYIRPHVADMAAEFIRLKPDCVHAWLDHQNIWSGIAALLVGVPYIVLSTRNVNPTHFPYLAQPWFKEWYQLLVQSPRVVIINNSRAGAADYAAWLGYPLARMRTILNGVDPEWIRRPEQAHVQDLRAQLLGERKLLVGGIFRLSEEKQPLLWLQTARRIAASRNDVVFFHAGEGPLDRQLAAASTDLVQSGVLHWLGRRSDIPALLSAADTLLHSARFEGTPNVLLEAAHLGCPVAATSCGGSADAVADHLTGLLSDPLDAEALYVSLSTLLNDEGMRQRFSEAGPLWIKQHFAMSRMVQETLACYPMLEPTLMTNGEQT